jgi:pimeloyl-ACP methyl ester carboxylesterase
MVRQAVIAIVCASSSILAPNASAQHVDTVFAEVHGHRMAFYVTGTGGPTVVMEAGGGSWHRDWVTIAPQVAQHTRVISYDRPGYALSEGCESPRTADRVSRELLEALESIGEAGPFVVVGWSLGGAYARVFAGAFPERTRGLVLVDPAPENFYRRMPREYPEDWSSAVAEHFPAVYGDPTRRGEGRELAAFDASVEQARASDAKHQTPTTILIAGREHEIADDPISRVWVEELTLWASKRPNTITTMVPNVGHHIPAQAPGAIVQAVIELIDRTQK